MKVTNVYEWTKLNFNSILLQHSSSISALPQLNLNQTLTSTQPQINLNSISTSTSTEPQPPLNLNLKLNPGSSQPQLNFTPAQPQP